MDHLKNTTVLEFHPNTLSEVRKIHKFDNSEDIKHAIDQLEQWLKEQTHFSKTDFSRCYLETTIISSKGSLERAQKRIENIFRLRTEQPQYFGNFDIKNDFSEFDGILTQAILPKQTKDYYRILLIKNSGKKFNSNLMLQLVRIYVMIFEYLKNHDYADGLIIVVDFIEVRLLEVLKKLTLTDLRQCASILIDGYGVRLKGMHIITTSRIINLLVWLFKQVLNAKLVTRIHVHQSVKTLYNFVPKEILPIEYGGCERPFTEIHENWREVLSTEEFRSYLIEMDKARIQDKSDESK